jgi:phenylpropionate dioxygenase-like ring-hydroxylating dioxygenase large terminal subunit
MDAQEYKALTRRAIQLVENQSRELAPEPLRLSVSQYMDPTNAENERRVVESLPIPVATSAQIANPGDYHVRDVLGRSLLISRDSDGTARVLLNYCRHRGALVASGSGNARRFNCPYHSWTYDRGGGLVAIPGEDGFTGCAKEDLGLIQLPSEERAGFVWTKLGGNGKVDLAAHLGEFESELTHWKLHEYYYVAHRDYELEANWKVALEAFNENYHFKTVHGDSVIGQGAHTNIFGFRTFGPHHRIEAPLISLEDVVGLPEQEWPDDMHHVAMMLLVFPTTVLAVGPFGVEVVEALPGQTPDKCTFRHTFLSKIAPDDEDERAGMLDYFEEVHAAVEHEDIPVIQAVGRAAFDGHLREFIIGRNEPGVQHFHRALTETISTLKDP